MAKTHRIAALFTVPALCAGISVVGSVPTYAAPDSSLAPYHPTMLWATSEETQGEVAPNGPISALVDDDSGKAAQDVSFWTSQWKGTEEDFPHALAFANPRPDQELCGVQYTARPTYGAVEGAGNAPGSFQLYSFESAPTNPRQGGDEAFNAWKQGLDSSTMEAGTLLSRGALKGVNDPLTISFPPTKAQAFSLVGLRAVAEDKKGMSGSDLKLIPCQPQFTDPGEGSGDNLAADFFVDQLPFGEPGEPVTFDPATHTYIAHAYYHTDQISIRVRPADPTASVSVNGLPADSDGRVSNLVVREGMNAFTATITAGGQRATYVVNVTKHNTDFRGNVLIDAAATINGGSEAEISALTDQNMATGWTVSPLKKSDEWSDNTTGFQLDLDQPRYVHRVSAWGWPQMPANAPGWHGGSSVAIAVQADDGAPWQTIITHASLTRDSGGLWYWDFNQYHQAKHIRVWLNTATEPQQQPGNPGNQATGMSVYEAEVWGLPAGHTPPEIAPNEHSDIYRGFDPGDGKWGVNRAQTLALQYGVMLPAWIPSEGYGRGAFDARESRLTGGAFPMFYDMPLFNTPVMEQIGEGTPWAFAKAPAGGNGIQDAGEPHIFLTDAMKPYADTLIDIQYGDEGGFSHAESDAFGRWFEWSKENIPGAVVHSNQYNAADWGQPANMEYYVQNAQPDLLSWDTYYYGSNWGSAPSSVVHDMLGNNMWKTQRQAALAGLTGDGTSPILYGQYLDYNWDANVSESQKAVVPSLGLATGQKWFGLFRMEYNGYDRSSIIDQDGAPTRSFYEFSRIFKDLTGLGKYAVALNSTYVGINAGEYADRPQAPNVSGYALGAFGEGDGKAANKAVGITGMDVTNTGTVNDGKPGDVVVGYFEKLPGLDAAKTEEIFGKTTQDPRAFMVVNALTGTTRWPSYGLSTRTDDGSYAQTAQDVTLHVEKPFDNAKLMMVDPNTFEAQPAPLTQSRSADSDLTVTLSNIGGGQARLLYWVGESPTADQGTQTDPQSADSQRAQSSQSDGSAQSLPATTGVSSDQQRKSSTNSGSFLAHSGASAQVIPFSLMVLGAGAVSIYAARRRSFAVRR